KQEFKSDRSTVCCVTTHASEDTAEPACSIIRQTRHFRNLRNYSIENIGTRSSKVKEDGSPRSMVVLGGTCSRAGEQEQIVDILSQQLRDLAKYFATDRGNGFGKLHYATTSFESSVKGGQGTEPLTH
ncbi:hypothetical protein K0M31_007216, partial [Melipona bicolor]